MSLAIYIYGVAQELFATVRGRGVYGLVKALTDSDIVVDVISGTSAGGINGILLAYALCNEREFGAVSSLWREKGDIETLLRSPGAHPEECLSLLDSRGVYVPALHGAFDLLGGAPCPRRTDEDPSTLQELDLFVTGTHVAGRVYTSFDDEGHAIDVKDHRTVFWLKHRAHRKEPLNPAFVPGVAPAITHRALAKLAALTSCFPVAFEPVEVTDTPPGDATADGKLQLWGRIGGAAHFLDGGVLDNKPFTSTVGAIFSRVADREVERRLFYVEPDPERFVELTDRGRSTAQVATAHPTAVQAALAALIAIPGYESIADDLKLLGEHNAKVELYTRLLERLQPSDLRPTVAGVPSAARDEVEAPTQPGNVLYVQTRLIALSDRVVTGILRRDGWDQPLHGERREIARELAKKFDDLVSPRGDDGVAPSDDAKWLAAARAILDRFDVYYRTRRAVRVVYLLYGRLHPAAGAQPLADGLREHYRRVLRAFNRQLKLYEIVRTAMESLVDEGPFPWASLSPADLWDQVQAAFANLLDTGAPPAQCVRAHVGNVARLEDWLPQRALSEVSARLRARGREIHGRIAAGDLTWPSPFTSMFGELEEYEERILQGIPDPGDPVRRAYAEFRDVDSRLYPAQMFGSVGERDVIRTVRISPCDAQTGFSARPMSEKLAGDAVHHFGGFFKRSWRSNDIMWGRLDGVCQLLECLVTVERLERIGEDDTLRPLVRQRLASFDMQRLFAGAGDKARADIESWLAHLVDDDPARRAEARGPAFKPMRALLIEAAQREILGEEVPNVIQDALLEQSQWNQYRVATTPGQRDAGGAWDPETWQFVASQGVVDPLVALTGAAEMARSSLASPAATDAAAPSPAATRLGVFFSQYRVGSEHLQRDVPRIVLLGVLARTLLAVRNCALQAMGPTLASKVRRSLPYQLFINAPLRAFDGVVRLVRAVPSTWTPLKVALPVVAVTVLVAGTAMHWREMATGLLDVALYIVAPLLALWLLAQVLFRQSGRSRRRGTGRIAGPASSRGSEAGTNAAAGSRRAA